MNIKIKIPIWRDNSYTQFLCWNDGGREEAGYKGSTRDCAVRAISIATQKSYKEVYDAINVLAKDERITKHKKTRSNARTGVYHDTLKKYMLSIGWEWTPTMKIGSGCLVHLRGDELPSGRIIARVSKHFVAVIDGVVHDAFDCTRNGTRCVYGYYSRT